MGGNVTTTGNNNNIWNFNFNFNSVGGHQGIDATQALHLLQNLPYFQDQMTRGSTRPMDMPGCGCIPPPRPDLSGAPAGRGLSTEPQAGWPAGTITTAGGYRIVPEGNTNWNIFNPNQQPGETPHTRVWGDPHVNEKDGTRWDFTGTKGLDGEIGNDFVLGDGTRIFARTSSDQGQSVTTGLEITNGADHVSVSGINSGKPTVGQIQQDGYEWRAAHVALAGDRSTFHLRGDTENVHWVRETRGNVDGLVTGARLENGSYTQNIDSTIKNIELGGAMRPPIGSRAWGNAFRSGLDDQQANFWGQVGGQFGVLPALANAYGIHANHINGAFQSDLQQLFGGWGSIFPNSGYGFNVMSLFRDLLMSDNEYQRSLQFGRNANMGWV
jgi:hypothetical protein